MAVVKKVQKFSDFRKKTSIELMYGAAKAYMYAALESYLRIEAQASSMTHTTFSHSANVICSLTRAIEHLLKLKLLTIDPMLMYPLPKKIEDFCFLKQIPIRCKNNKHKQVHENHALKNTITYNEAILRLELLDLDYDFDYEPFRHLYNLRNRIEHNWDNSDEFLVKVIAQLKPKLLPAIEDYIENVLNEKPSTVIDHIQYQKVETLDRAISNGLTLRIQQAADKHKKIYEWRPKEFTGIFKIPEDMKSFEEQDIEKECPVCSTYLTVLYIMEADWDYADGESYICGAYPSTGLLFCRECHFYLDDCADIDHFLPDGLEIDYDMEDYY